MQGRPLPEQVADEVVQARDRLLVGNPFGDPLVVLDLGVDFFALLAHVPTTRPPADPISGEARQFAPGYPTSPCWLRLGRTMVKVSLFLGGLAILLVSSRQVFLMFRDGSFRARGNRLIVRNAHPIIFWMNFIGLVLFGVVGVALICWQLLT